MHLGLLMITFNNDVAQKLREIAALLKAQHANHFRCQAYLKASQTIDNSPEDISLLFKEQGIKGLIHIPTIGTGIAHLIYEYITTGRISRLEKLQGLSDPLALFQLIPTIGRQLAQRIHDKLHINTLASLENAVHAGQLEQIEGLGEKRRRAIEDWLSRNFTEPNKALQTYSAGLSDKDKNNQPSVELLLNLDTQYRDKASAGKLPLITPKRFNPENKAWLPVLHTKKAEWHFTLIYSNTERAHKLERVYDWVIILFYDNNHQEGQYTVVTEVRGNLKGQRVVRGREDECRAYYNKLKQAV